MQTFTNKMFSYLLAVAVALFMSTASIAQGSADAASPDYAAAGAAAGAAGAGGLGAGLGGVLGGIGIGTAIGVGLAAIAVGVVVADQVEGENNETPTVPGTASMPDTSTPDTTTATTTN